MRPAAMGTRTLFALAVIAVVVLMALSDFRPERPTGLESVGEDQAELTLVVLRCRPCTNGHLLNLSDGNGVQVDAFCSLEVRSDPVPNGSVVRALVERSADGTDFLIVLGLEVLVAPAGKD